MILSIDTTSEFGSVALTSADQTIEEVAIRSAEGFGHLLFQHIEALLGRHNTTVNDLTCLAVASGPGSFTGVRVGITAAKGLGEAAGKKVVAVSNLRAVAFFGSAPKRAVVIDAHRGEIYGGLYNEQLEALQPEAVLSFSRWQANLPHNGIEIISADFAPFRADIHVRFQLVDAPRALAAAIGRIAWREWQSGTARAPEEIDANYVRRSDAELLWKG